MNGVPPGDPNFQFYLLLRHPAHGNSALQLKWKYTQTDTGFHPSLSRIWPSAGLAEREIWELLGVAFSGNDNLFPLLLDPQFPGWPLRRDFALPVRQSYAERLLRERYDAGLLAQVSSATVLGRASAEDAGRDARATENGGAP
jgi:NADH:ubiquinone oxidoreductase subunit C